MGDPDPVSYLKISRVRNSDTKKQTQERVRGGNVSGFCDTQVKTPWHERQAQVCDHPFSDADATDAVFTLPEMLPHGTRRVSRQCVLCCKLLTDIRTDATLQASFWAVQALPCPCWGVLISDR